MKGSIVSSDWFAGMLVVMAYVLVMVESRAAFPRGFKRVMPPEDIIDQWHKNKANHYKFERRLTLGRDHPYDRYSRIKMYWPGERWPIRSGPVVNRGRITSFECMNRTPAAARALMRVLQGGIGFPYVVLEVLYAPVSLVMMNAMIITCHIYTEGTDVETNEEESIWHPLSDPKIDEHSEPDQIDENPMENTFRANSGGFQGMSPVASSMSLGRSRARPVDTMTHKAIECPELGKITVHIGDVVSGRREIFEIMCGGTIPAASETSSQTIGNNGLRKLRENSSDTETSLTSSSGLITAPTEWSTYEVTTSASLEVLSPQIVCRKNLASPSIGDQSSETEEAVVIQSENVGLATDLASYDTFRMSLKTISENTQDEEDENLKTKRSTEQVTKPLAFNSVLKIMPIGEKKRIGLAKITY